jgi:energy-converting hydrogenase Eha subunit C
MEWVTLGIVLVVLLSAVAVLLMKNFLAALAALSVVSLGMAVLFVILRAPDVAMTEAAHWHCGVLDSGRISRRCAVSLLHCSWLGWPYWSRRFTSR